MVDQRGRRVIAGEVAVGLEEDDCEVPRPRGVEIHRQECDVQHRVAEPEPVVELEAVDHPRSVVGEVDVGGEEVPVAVDDPAGRHAGPQQRGPPPQVARRQGRDVVDDLRGVPTHVESAQVVEGLRPQPRHRGGGARGVDLLRAGAGGVEVVDLPGHLADAGHDVRIAVPGRALLPRPHQRGEAPVRGEATHPHDVIDHLAVGAPHLQHAGVDVRGQSTVELDLTAALLRPRLDGGVVEEAEIQWLAHFVSLVTPEDDERTVGLHEARRARRRGI